MLVPDIRKRVGFVLFAFAAFVFMIHVQLPGVDQRGQVSSRGHVLQLPRLPLGRRAAEALDHRDGHHALHQRLDHHAVDDGRAPAARRDGEEGRRGRPQAISQYTRWLTIVLAVVQATTMSINMSRSGVFYDTSWQFFVYAVIAFVSGTLFLMWLGEQITDKGIGNGVSLIIFVGIVLRYPDLRGQTFSARPARGLQLPRAGALLAIALITIVSIIFMYQGQRRIPVQQARRVVGRKMFAGRSSYIPLRLNNAGVISIIFAISILLLPQQALSWFAHSARHAAYWHLGPDRIPQNSTRSRSRPPDLLQPEHARSTTRVLRAGRHLHVLLQLDRRQTSKTSPTTSRRAARSSPASGPASRPSSTSAHPASASRRSPHLPRPARDPALDAAARTRRHDVLPRLDLAADRGRRGARYDDADRSAARDARLQGLHQAMSTSATQTMRSSSSDRRAPARARRPRSSRTVSARADLDGRHLARQRRRGNPARPRGEVATWTRATSCPTT
jgi:hypothetical protein